MGERVSKATHLPSPEMRGSGEAVGSVHHVGDDLREICA